MATRKYVKDLYIDLTVIIFGLVIATLLVQAGAVQEFLHLTEGMQGLTAFVAGIFFTSAFTLAPASVVLSQIHGIPSFEVALLGGLGAMIGDVILFLFIRDRFSEHIMRALGHSKWKHIVKSFHFGFLKYLSPVLGAAIIASPLPDEFGLMLMGASRMNVALLLPISFFMNVVGVYLIISLTSLI